jgi:hypothetical protein
MGIVYQAHDPRLEVEVALKVPYEDVLANPVGLQRFYREARAAARLRHPNLCAVIDVDELDGVPYLAMQYIHGQPLSEAPPQAPHEAVRLVRTLARAMAEAHRLEVIHRDLKESNVILTPQGEPVIVDFGLAVRLDQAGDELTMPGFVAGTVPYMAPELVAGGRDVSGACDVYSLGVILYRLLTGRLPFQGRDAYEVRRRILDEAPLPPSQVRPDLDRRLDVLCLKALAKSSQERFASMTELAGALSAYLEGAPTEVSGRAPLPREVVRFAFAGVGERAPAAGAVRDRLYLDVGNDLRAGVIDHHHLTGGGGATASLVLAHPAYLDGAVAPGRASGAPFVVVLHEAPDLDSVASAYLAVAYLTGGAFPDGAEALARYVERVDDGALGMTLANPFALYAAYQQLVHRLARRGWNSNHERWQELVRGGLRLVGYVVEQVARHDLALPAVDAFACPDLFGPEDRRDVLEDVERYQRKLADPRCGARLATLRLPGQYGGAMPAEALLIRDVQNVGDPQRCMFFKDWARSDAARSPNGRGFVALSVFVSEGPRQVRRCILSVAPDSGATLRGLGALLDRAECERRRDAFGVDDRVEEPVSGARLAPRPGYDNADPWYDGRAHAFTIVDSPRSGTLLTADEIEAIFLRFGKAAS